MSTLEGKMWINEDSFETQLAQHVFRWMGKQAKTFSSPFILCPMIRTCKTECGWIKKQQKGLCNQACCILWRALKPLPRFAILIAFISIQWKHFGSMCIPKKFWTEMDIRKNIYHIILFVTMLPTQFGNNKFFR